MNPYAAPNENIVQSATDLFGNYRIAEQYRPDGRKQTTERGELLKYMARKLGYIKNGKPDIGRVAWKLSHIKDLRDLYYIKSDCDAYEREGKGAWSKAFHGMLKVR